VGNLAKSAYNKAVHAAPIARSLSRCFFQRNN